MIAANILLITFAIVTLAAVARSKHPVRPTTAAFLALLTGGWMWANLRDSGWQDVLNEDTPAKLDPVTKAMFWRGWPLAPVMICETYFNTILNPRPLAVRPEELRAIRRAFLRETI